MENLGAFAKFFFFLFFSFTQRNQYKEMHIFEYVFK